MVLLSDMPPDAAFGGPLWSDEQAARNINEHSTPRWNLGRLSIFASM
jgi:hypothetical protein